MATRRRVNKCLGVGVVRGRSRRSSDDGVEYGVKVVGEVVTAWIDVYGGLDGFYKNGLFDAPPDPIIFRGHGGHVFFAKVVVIFAGVLKHRRFELALVISGCRAVLSEAGGCGALSLSHVSARAGYGVGSCAWNVVDVTKSLALLQLVFGFN